MLLSGCQVAGGGWGLSAAPHSRAVLLPARPGAESGAAASSGVTIRLPAPGTAAQPLPSPSTVSSDGLTLSFLHWTALHSRPSLCLRRVDAHSAQPLPSGQRVEQFELFLSYMLRTACACGAELFAMRT